MGGTATEFADDYLLGLLAVRLGLVTNAQMDEAVSIRLRSFPTPRLLDVLTDLGRIPPEGIERLSALHRTLLLGSIALGCSWLTSSQLGEALEIQRRSVPKPLLGAVLIATGFMTRSTLKQLLAMQEDAVSRALLPSPTRADRRRLTRQLRLHRRPSRPPADRRAEPSWRIGLGLAAGAAALAFVGWALTDRGAGAPVATTEVSHAPRPDPERPLSEWDRPRSISLGAATPSPAAPPAAIPSGIATAPAPAQPLPAPILLNASPAIVQPLPAAEAPVPAGSAAPAKPAAQPPPPAPAPRRPAPRPPLENLDRPPDPGGPRRAKLDIWPSGRLSVLTGVEGGAIVESVEWLEPDRRVHLTLFPDVPNHWFLFALRGARGKSVEVEVAGRQTIHGSFPWSGVQPVMADAADISRPDWYDASGARVTPQPWRRIGNARYDAKSRTMAFTVEMVRDEATVSLKYPCIPSYTEARLAALKRHPAVGLYEAGKTPEGRSLRVVTVPRREGNAGRWKTQPTILIYGGEHATEQESSHPVMGALDWILGPDAEAARLRQSVNVVLVPHLSPDDTANSVFDRCTEGFCGDNFRYGPENVAWAGYWNRWIEEGNALDLVFCFHNIGGSEGPNVFCPAVQELNESVAHLKAPLAAKALKELKASGYRIGEGVGFGANLPMRLFGWLDARFGATSCVLEVNSQCPARPLSMQETRNVGAVVLKSACAYLAEPGRLTEVRQRMRIRLAERKERKDFITAKRPASYWASPPLWAVFNLLW